ncbi:MAG: hypothetical protein CL957_00525 [Euryarchaeota archaeon]|nr:hypothetical protein [Euryarchaeota archaeon]
MAFVVDRGKARKPCGEVAAAGEEPIIEQFLNGFRKPFCAMEKLCNILKFKERAAFFVAPPYLLFMRKIIAFCLISSLPLLSAEKEEVAIKTLQKRGEAGNQRYYLPHQDTPFTGKAVAYWQGGQKMTEISYKDGKRDGIKAHWYETGGKLSEIAYKGGTHHGPLIAWNELGQLRRKGTHVDGQMDGIWRNWYKTGQKENEATYIDGLMGTAIVWTPEGERCSETNVEDGNGLMVRYTEDGWPWLRITYRNGKMTGWRHFPPPPGKGPGGGEVTSGPLSTSQQFRTCRSSISLRLLRRL